MPGDCGLAQLWLPTCLCLGEPPAHGTGAQRANAKRVYRGEMLIEAVEHRFGSVEAVPAAHALQFLSDNAGAYTAAETRALARAPGLKANNTPVCSPQSNGMAESIVNTFKRDHVARMDLRDARTVLPQRPAAFEHFNEAHPHSSLKMRSPREFRRQQAAGADQVLYCE